MRAQYVFFPVKNSLFLKLSHAKFEPIISRDLERFRQQELKCLSFGYQFNIICLRLFFLVMCCLLCLVDVTVRLLFVLHSVKNKNFVIFVFLLVFGTLLWYIECDDFCLNLFMHSFLYLNQILEWAHWFVDFSDDQMMFYIFKHVTFK